MRVVLSGLLAILVAAFSGVTPGHALAMVAPHAIVHSIDAVECCDEAPGLGACQMSCLMGVGLPPLLRMPPPAVGVATLAHARPMDQILTGCSLDLRDRPPNAGFLSA